MNRDGYTLAEALAALLMVGLAVGGLTQAVMVIGRVQAKAAVAIHDDAGLREAGHGLSRLLADTGPFASDTDGFRGDAQALDFACGPAARCSAHLSDTGGAPRLILDFGGKTRTVALPAGAPLAFAYESADGRGDAWPPRAAPKRLTLRAVTLSRLSPQGADLITRARIWSEQPADCLYDMIVQDCRKAAP
jgi:hypothetical protein